MDSASYIERVASRFLVHATSVENWVARVREWNRTHDMTAAHEESELLDLLLCDALTLAAHVPEGARVVDIGSGAGAPGLPLALLRPDLKVTLVEPQQKRVSLMRLTVASLGRLDIKVVGGRVEDIVKAGTRFDVAISRATLSPAEWLETGTHLVEPGGSIWVLLAKDAAPSCEGCDRAEEVTYQWPLTNRERTAVRYTRSE